MIVRILMTVVVGGEYSEEELHELVDDALDAFVDALPSDQECGIDERFITVL